MISCGFFIEILSSHAVFHRPPLLNHGPARKRRASVTPAARRPAWSRGSPAGKVWWKVAKKKVYNHEIQCHQCWKELYIRYIHTHIYIYIYNIRLHIHIHIHDIHVLAEYSRGQPWKCGFHEEMDLDPPKNYGVKHGKISWFFCGYKHEIAWIMSYLTSNRSVPFHQWMGWYCCGDHKWGTKGRK